MIRSLIRGLATAFVAVAVVAPALANGFNENNSWQFSTSQDKVNKSIVLDQIEKKKSGYYDAMKPVYNNTYTTHIDRQYNCTLSSTTAGNSGTNDTTASTSSPSVSNSGSTNSTTAANSATNGLAQDGGPHGVLVSGVGTGLPNGAVDNNQSNSGGLSSGVTGSNTNPSTGAIAANGGTTNQSLNSQQNNTGTLTSSVSGSSACVGVGGGPLN